MKIFYAHSTFRESTYKTYENICDNIDDKRVEIINKIYSVVQMITDGTHLFMNCQKKY